MAKHPFKPYQRYDIESKTAPNIIDHPHRFKVFVKKHKLASLLIQELIHYKNLEVVKSRPCVYGVFSGPLGGFAPREKLCVGCLRCTTQYPEMVTILHNPGLQKLGDSYFLPEYIDTLIHEAESGRIPIKGQGYRGPFGGPGWDGLWTDMSEIVRPTRDGIHGREFISTAVDIGGKPAYLKFNFNDQQDLPKTVTLPIPILLDIPPATLQMHPILCRIFAEAANQLHTYAILPLKSIVQFGLRSKPVIPLVSQEELKELHFEPPLIAMQSWNLSFYQELKERFPYALPILRCNFESEDLLPSYKAGVRIFHLTANYHGKGESGNFIMELIQQANQVFVDAKCRDEVSLIGSGGIIASEHLPKAILCGLDAVALDTPLFAALQAKFKGQCITRATSHFALPSKISFPWGVQRIKNVACAWHAQLLEVLGAMGLCEVRRMRGEKGRVMFQQQLEKEAFAEIDGYQ